MASTSKGERLLALSLVLFTLVEVNYPHLSRHGQLAVFAGLGLVLCFLRVPAWRRRPDHRGLKILDGVLLAASALCCGYVLVQSEPAFSRWWSAGSSLGDRAGAETGLDLVIGGVGLVLILEATRRTIGPALPLLSLAFLGYAHLGPSLPEWLFPHRGYGFERIVSQTFLHSQGVFGTALQVMFTYVFLFVLFGAVLEITGATAFILRFAQRVFSNSPGAAAKVAVLSSGLMGSLSGSAVANTATTGTFTIPMMRSSGMKAETAGGIEAAASSGGALVPPVMGAGAYMMLELVEPPVTYLEIIRAALLPAVLYYLSLFLIVHFRSKLRGLASQPEGGVLPEAPRFGGIVFATAFAALIAFLAWGYTPFRAVTMALGVTLVLAACHPSTRAGARNLMSALEKAARDMLPLIAASACVGIILGVVTLTGIGTRLPGAILPLAQENLLLALVALMVSSIVLGMGLPSAVCYLLLATLVGPALGDLGVVPLAAHLFIFYFGMMSMVTPPVALAAYTAASIAGSGILKTSFAAFRFALVGFTLPFMFVLRPQLLLLSPDGGPAGWSAVLPALSVAVLGIVAFASGIAGYLFGALGVAQRALLLVAAALLLAPGPNVDVLGLAVPILDAGGLAMLTVAAGWSYRSRNAL